jgi:drug/metabolite transporter (DMT)-like permease
VIYLGLVPALPSAATWTYALGALGAARAANFLYLVPPVATALAFFWAGEVPSLTTLAGGAVVLTGVVLVNRFGR